MFDATQIRSILNKESLKEDIEYIIKINTTEDGTNASIEEIKENIIKTDNEITNIKEVITQTNSNVQGIDEDLTGIRSNVELMNQNITLISESIDKTGAEIVTSNESIENIKNDINKILAANKFDDVILNDNNMMCFYAGGELIKEIQLPSSIKNRAVCGEFLSGELSVGYNITETYDLALSTPTVWVDNETPVNAFNMNSIENKIIALKNLIDGQPSAFYIGITPPENTNALWVDTSSDVEDFSVSNVILEEIRSAMSMMQLKINELEEQITVLISSGGAVYPSNSIVTENGDIFITESGDKIILEGVL